MTDLEYVRLHTKHIRRERRMKIVAKAIITAGVVAFVAIVATAEGAIEAFISLFF